VASFAGLHLLLLPIPGANPLLFAALCGVSWAYFRWHLCREAQRLPVAWFEKVLLGLVAMVLIGMSIVLAVLLWLASK
jgi:hypothetical protein